MSTHNSAQVQLLQAVGGAVSGGLTRFLAQPFDVLKIRFQLQVEPIKKKTKTSKYNGIIHAFSTIYREEGLRGIWKGHNSAQIMSITYALVQFWAYEQLRTAASQYTLFQKHPHVSYFMCGGVAGCIGTIAAQPFDVVRTRVVAADPGSQAASLRAVSGISKVFKHEGMRGVSSGLALTLLQIFPLVGSNYVIYKNLNHLVGSLISAYKPNPNRTQHMVPGVVLFINAALSGVLSKMVVYPLDLVKKRRMLSHFQHDRKTFGNNPNCNTLMFCIKDTMAREGLLGFYKGMLPTLYKSGVVSAFYFTIYDYYNHYVTMPYQKVEYHLEKQRLKEQQNSKP